MRPALGPVDAFMMNLTVPATRVFICDDVPEFRLLLREVLREDGLEVVGEAGDGESCIAGVVRERPDVLLLDLSMPGFDGLQTLERLKGLASPPRVVVLSGFGADEMREQALSRGAHAYVEKGAPFADIIAAVEAAAQRV